VLLLVVGVHKTNRCFVRSVRAPWLDIAFAHQPPSLVGKFLFVIHQRPELFQIKSLTWLLDRTLLVGDSRDTRNNEVVFDSSTSQVYDLCQRATRRQKETGTEQILAVDFERY
jgi:hypothetical protein